MVSFTLLVILGLFILLTIAAMSTVRFSPKDFFLWVGSMVALYVSVGALVTLLFNYINILFPDPLDMSYGDPYSGPVRFAIAALLVVFPLFLYLTRLVHEDIRRDSEKAGLGIRRWLVYLTVFVAGAFLAGDLITVINTFLNGELTTRFSLKALTVFVLAGGIFWYYLEEVRGRWEKDAKLSTMIGAFVGALVALAVVSGFFIIGTPGDARAMRFDQERVSALETLQWEIIEYWRVKRELPLELADLVNSVRFAELPRDPETDVPYGYQVKGDMTFELCAIFSRSQDRNTPYARPIAPGILGSDWSHPEGAHCFERTIDPDYYRDDSTKGLVPPVR